MPAQRQTNMHSLTALLCEVRDSDGTLYPATAVDPGVSVDWPQPIAGFTGWNWESHHAASAAEAGLTAPEASTDESATAVADSAPKSRSKASTKAADPTEVTG